MQLDDLLVALERPGADLAGDAILKPNLQEVAYCLALAGQGEPVGKGALGGLELAACLLARCPIESAALAHHLPSDRL